jgi:NAD(P)-dependent dehydrogenase (short-subunit alcohol dehydrogenase family)
MFSLKGKTVIVTGGGRGIGRGISVAMAEAGANVVLAGRNAQPLQETAEAIAAMGGTALPFACDITRSADIDRLVRETRWRFGYIDCLVNNAGSASPSDNGPLLDLDEGQWDRVVDLNLKWTFFTSQAVVRTMDRGGSIINITSRSASAPTPLVGHYAAAKAGLESLTGTMAVEWGHLGIRVNAIAPGVVLVDNLTTMQSESRQRRQIETIPLQRLGKPEDVGPLAVYFASDEAQWVSGTVVPVNGGSRIPISLLSYLHKVNAPKD